MAKKTETGWTDSPTQGVYWWRLGANDTPDPVRIKNGFAEGKLISVYGGEFLGPISPSDFEQLTRLREIAKQFVVAYEGKEHQLGNGQALRSFLQLREALAQPRTGGES